MLLGVRSQGAGSIFTDWEDYGRAYIAGRRQWVERYRADPLGRPGDEDAPRRWQKTAPAWGG
jgi:hypothetical protein